MRVQGAQEGQAPVGEKNPLRRKGRTLRVDGRGQTVLCRIGDLDRLVVRLELDDARDRAKDFLLGNPHVHRHIGEGRRLNKVAFGAVPLT
jgi:hypothetical protein